MGKLARVYNTKLCFPETKPNPLKLLALPHQNTTDYPRPGQCLHGEPDFERLMKRPDMNVEQLKWIWKTWHDFVGPPIKEEFVKLVEVENSAARENGIATNTCTSHSNRRLAGYTDTGEVWKEELEIPDLEDIVVLLYQQVKTLYEMLHAVVRYKLFLKYGPDIVNPVEPIPIHLLGMAFTVVRSCNLLVCNIR